MYIDHDENNINDCQMQSLPGIQQVKTGSSEDSFSFVSRIRLFFRRHLDVSTRKKVKKLLFLDRVWRPKTLKTSIIDSKPTAIAGTVGLCAGELVRVRSRDEILATLDADGKVKGCSFISGMWEYCGTTQKVLKPVRRFVDERNYRVINPQGIVLLEGVNCRGTDFYGKCDRACYFFWREEWLEKL